MIFPVFCFRKLVSLLPLLLRQMNDRINISGYILSGGKSSRMGTDKALLAVQDEPMLKRMINLVAPFCNAIAISGQKNEYAVYKIEMVPDLYSGCGPISGIVSSLKHSTTEWNLFVSVDVPFINEELIEYLISLIGQNDCIVPLHDAGLEPLIGLYNRKIVPIAEEMISQGDYKLTQLLSKLSACYVDCNYLIKKYPRLFLNINRMEDYRSI